MYLRGTRRCLKGKLEKSAVAEHVWENHHAIHWEETTVLHGPWQRTGVLVCLGEGGPTHPDDTLGEAL